MSSVSRITEVSVDLGVSEGPPVPQGDPVGVEDALEDPRGVPVHPRGSTSRLEQEEVKQEEVALVQLEEAEDSKVGHR